MIFTTIDGLTFSVALKDRTAMTLGQGKHGMEIKFAFVVGIYAGSPSVIFYDENLNPLYVTIAVKSVSAEGDVLGVENPDLVEPGHVIFRTENSVYEIDQEQKRFRRIAGLNPLNSKHLAADLEWTTYLRVVVEKGHCGLIYYEDEKARRTSIVRDIFGTVIEQPDASN